MEREGRRLAETREAVKGMEQQIREEQATLIKLKTGLAQAQTVSANDLPRLSKAHGILKRLALTIWSSQISLRETSETSASVLRNLHNLHQSTGTVQERSKAERQLESVQEAERREEKARRKKDSGSVALDPAEAALKTQLRKAREASAAMVRSPAFSRQALYYLGDYLKLTMEIQRRQERSRRVPGVSPGYGGGRASSAFIWFFPGKGGLGFPKISKKFLGPKTQGTSPWEWSGCIPIASPSLGSPLLQEMEVEAAGEELVKEQLRLAEVTGRLSVLDREAATVDHDINEAKMELKVQANRDTQTETDRQTDLRTTRSSWR